MTFKTFGRNAVRVGATTLVAAATALVVFGNYQVYSDIIPKAAKRVETAQIELNRISKNRASNLLSAADARADCLHEVEKGPHYVGNPPRFIITKGVCETNFKQQCDGIIENEADATKELGSANKALFDAKVERNVFLFAGGLAAFFATVGTWLYFPRLAVPKFLRRKKEQDTADNVAKTPESVSTHS